MKSLLLLLLLACVTAFAEDVPDGPIDAYFQQGSSDGKLESCSIVFTSVTRDFATQKGARVIVNGSFALRKVEPERIFVSGKLGTRIFPTGAAWEEPAHFFFATANRSTAGRAKMAASDTAGYKLLIAALDNEMAEFVNEMLASGQFTVGFNRRSGGQDVTVPVKLAVSLQKDASGNAQTVNNPETYKQFLACMGKLLK
jgi:hypothetical protein